MLKTHHPVQDSHRFTDHTSWLPDMVFLDLETTGGTPLNDRITEIALIKIEHGEITQRWQTLVNPGISIPPFISKLTGITDAMVADAPSFADVAAELYGHLEGFIMAAHNARFDHGFLKAEYKRIGATLRQRVLCTVKLSRRLFPQQKSHGLDAIMHRHGLTTQARHRGMGDVQLMLDFLQAAKRELGSVQVLEEISQLSKGPSLPPGIDSSFVDKMPDHPGVYLFYGENELPLYVGKSIKLRSRVLNHFSSDHASAREMEIAQEVKRIDWIETAGELGALLLEAQLVKQKQPVYNLQLRQVQTLYSIKLSERLNQNPWISIVTSDTFHPTYFEHLYGIFRTKKSALAALQNLAKEHLLCSRMIGLERGKGSCFAHQIKQCSGICSGKEKAELHYLKLKQALVGLRQQRWPYQGPIGIREAHAKNGLAQVHVFDQWCYIASAEDDVQLDEALQSRCEYQFDLDVYKLLTKILPGNPADSHHLETSGLGNPADKALIKTNNKVKPIVKPHQIINFQIYATG